MSSIIFLRHPLQDHTKRHREQQLLPDVERDKKDIEKTLMLVQSYGKIKRLSGKFEILNFLHDVEPLNFYNKTLLNPFDIYVI